MAVAAQTLDRPIAFVRDRPSWNPRPLGAAVAAIALGALSLSALVGWRQSALFLVGAGAGVVLYHAAFGFTTSWRVFIVNGRGAGLRAQLIMLAVTSAVFFPLLASGHVFGQTVRGSVSPVGVSVAVGAFLFGVGMQLGGGCASGTLYTAGGGNTRMVATLLAFIAGSVAGTAHMPWWAATPAFKPLSLVATLGVASGLALSFALLSAVWWITVVVERRRHGALDRGRIGDGPGTDRGQIGDGSGTDRGQIPRWPLLVGALGLAAVNIATLAVSGRPWGVTGAFALWGAKALAATGAPVAAWPFWSTPAQAAALRAPVINDVTSVMDIGIMLGALAAAASAGRFAPTWRVEPRSLAAALIGGLLLGYGARIAYGCNIGAYFSGIASGSLHGWLWLAAAFGGSAVGTKLRPAFGLRVERETVVYTGAASPRCAVVEPTEHSRSSLDPDSER